MIAGYRRSLLVTLLRERGVPSRAQGSKRVRSVDLHELLKKVFGAVRLHRHVVFKREVDPVRQGIADSWPHSLDCSAARAEWGFSPQYSLAGMVDDMLTKLRPRIS